MEKWARPWRVNCWNLEFLGTIRLGLQSKRSRAHIAPSHCQLMSNWMWAATHVMPVELERDRPPGCKQPPVGRCTCGEPMHLVVSAFSRPFTIPNTGQWSQQTWG
jgi:hypothetical protein